MKFYINNKELNGVMDLSDKLSIKSSNKNYNVFYNHKSLNDLVNELYRENDFILIDRNVYNLSPITFKDLTHNILIFDALEDNKNIENVLILVDILLDKKFK